MAKDRWDDGHYVTAYKLAASGQNDVQIARVLGVSSKQFAKWVEGKPALVKALAEGRDRIKRLGVRAFMQHVTDRMPDDLKDLWEQLSSEDDGLRQRACSNVKEADVMHQQHLFVSAFIAMNCSVARACQATGIKESTVAGWKADRRFRRLSQTIRDALGDFYEQAMIDLVHAREPSAVIHVARTYNADRGYGNRLQVDVNQQVEHRHGISVKDLSPDTIRAMLEESRRKKQALVENKSDVIDAEFEQKSG